MTIDEAIKHQRDMAEKYKYQLVLNETGHPMYALGDREIPRIEKYVEEYTQVAEWLEELKAIKENTVFYSNRPIEDIILEARADAIDEVFKKLYDIRDSLPFKYSEHWTSRDSDAISTLFIEYEKQLKDSK